MLLMKIVGVEDLQPASSFAKVINAELAGVTSSKLP
jgi:hypothetical protein